MYYLLIWFFVFSFILFIVNSLMYKLGDKLFRRDADHDILGSWLGPIFPKPFYENGRVQNRR